MNCAMPIMGPEYDLGGIIGSTAELDDLLEQCAILTRTFFGSDAPLPVTVVMRSMSGMPLLQESQMAVQVPAFCTTVPIHGQPAGGSQQ